MKYISVEDFMSQPKEIQQIFLDWWQPEEFDICADRRLEKHSVTQSDLGDIYNYYLNTGSIPFFTEGQLREFIEDRISKIIDGKCKINIYYKTKKELDLELKQKNSDYFEEYGYDIITLQQEEEGYYFQIINSSAIGGIQLFNNLGTDLLKAYWKVACKVAQIYVNKTKNKNKRKI